jgi:alpha-1,3-glucan synthase
MFANTAWQRHGCYTLGSLDISDFPVGKAATGCTDDWNSLDHFDVTAESRLVWKRINQIRKVYPVLVDGFSLFQAGKWTMDQVPTSRGVVRTYGLWSVYRDWLTNGTNPGNSSVWLLYSNKVT